MATSASLKRKPGETRGRLVGATIGLMLHRGFPATTVDEICAAAGVTKGSFFHYFATKEEIGKVALAAWGEHGLGIYAGARADAGDSGLEQFHKLIEIMIGLAKRPCEPGDPLACLVGMVSQEMAVENEVLRAECSSILGDWTEMVRALLEKAKRDRKPLVDLDAEEVAWFFNSLWQGSMLIGKTRREPRIVIQNLELMRDYVDGLFGYCGKTEKELRPARAGSKKREIKPTKERKRK